MLLGAMTLGPLKCRLEELVALETSFESAWCSLKVFLTRTGPFQIIELQRAL